MPIPENCCRHLEGARHNRPASEIAELTELLQPLPGENEKGERLYRCRQCGRLWREWVQYVYDDEIYLFAAVEQDVSPSQPKPRSCAAVAWWGALAGLVLGFLTQPPLPEEAVRIWPSVLRPLSEEAARRMDWAVGLLLAGMACGFIICVIVRRWRC